MSSSIERNLIIVIALLKFILTFASKFCIFNESGAIYVFVLIKKKSHCE